MLKLIFPQNQWAKGPHCNLLPRFPPVTTTHPCTVTSHIIPGCLIEYCRNDGTSFHDQVIKSQRLLSWSFSLSCSLVSLSLWPFYLRFISRLSTFICKGPGSEYIGWVSHSVSITAIQLCTCSREVARDINKWMWLSSNGTLLWPLKFEFHLIFMCHKILFFIFP